jgi:hypothetical protein
MKIDDHGEGKSAIRLLHAGPDMGCLPEMQLRVFETKDFQGGWTPDGTPIWAPVLKSWKTQSIRSSHILSLLRAMEISQHAGKQFVVLSRRSGRYRMCSQRMAITEGH